LGQSASNDAGCGAARELMRNFGWHLRALFRSFVLSGWYARCRRIDIEMLWPSCKRYGNDLDHAKAAFALHAFNDPAWLFLGESEVTRIIYELR